jgi:hypothetical protein
MVHEYLARLNDRMAKEAAAKASEIRVGAPVDAEAAGVPKT